MSATNDLRDLAIRITKLPGWRWMRGMTASAMPLCGPVLLSCDEDGERHTEHIVRPGGDGNEVTFAPEWGIVGRFPGDYSSPFIPDLTDPATAGCLLALLGENRATRGAVFVLVEATHARTLGEACARAALALGRWPGGVE